MKPEAPCKNCTDRHLGCHSECEEYIAYKQAAREYTVLVAKARSQNRKLEDLKWLQWDKHHVKIERPK